MITWTLGLFAPILVLVGILGFVVPADRAMTSGAPAYNMFHLAFGMLGLGIVATGNDPAIRAFLIVFGAIDLYQALASRRRWFPAARFRWKPADDVLHVVIGAMLIAIGVFGS